VFPYTVASAAEDVTTLAHTSGKPACNGAEYAEMSSVDVGPCMYAPVAVPPPAPTAAGTHSTRCCWSDYWPSRTGSYRGAGSNQSIGQGDGQECSPPALLLHRHDRMVAVLIPDRSRRSYGRGGRFTLVGHLDREIRTTLCRLGLLQCQGSRKREIPSAVRDRNNGRNQNQAGARDAVARFESFQAPSTSPITRASSPRDETTVKLWKHRAVRVFGQTTRSQRNEAPRSPPPLPAHTLRPQPRGGGGGGASSSSSSSTTGAPASGGAKPGMLGAAGSPAGRAGG